MSNHTMNISVRDLLDILHMHSKLLNRGKLMYVNTLLDCNRKWERDLYS